MAQNCCWLQLNVVRCLIENGWVFLNIFGAINSGRAINKTMIKKTANSVVESEREKREKYREREKEREESTR